MDKNKFQSTRPELTIAEVVAEFGCTVDDLFYEAAMGNLAIYVMTNNWNAKSVYQVDNSKKCTDLKITYTGPTPPPMPSTYNPDEYKTQADAWIEGITRQDTTVGNVTSFGKNGPYREIYLLSWSDLQPIAAKTFLNYRKDKDSSEIELNLNRMIKGIPDHLNLYFCPDPEVRLIDALNDGKLFIKREDLWRLTSNSSLNPDNAKPNEGVHRKTLLKLIIGMAVDAYGYDHAATKSPFPSELQQALELQGIDCTDDTIRKALKEAATVLPHKIK